MTLEVPYTTRTTCRVCGSGGLRNLFSLGTQLVSDFVEEADIGNGIVCPIDIVLCEKCSLVQQKHTARQDFLYTRHYYYRSGTTETMRKALREVTASVETVANLKDGDVVLDIGSNDGTLLRSYAVEGLWKVGVDPARNLVEEGKQGVDVFIGDFWSAEEYIKQMSSSEI